MSDVFNVTAVPFRPPETNSEARLPPATEVADNSVDDLARASFVSPVAQLDVDTNLVLFQFRDSTTGEITRQFPSDQRILSFQNGTGFSPTDLANFVANLPEAESNPTVQQTAAAVEELQSGPELSGITTPDDAVAPTAIDTATETATAPADTATPDVGATTATPEAPAATDPPPAPEPVVVSSGQPANGVSDVTNTGTDAAPDDSDVQILASAE